MSDSLRPHELQHARLPCPSQTLRACSNSCPWSQWCRLTIPSSVVPFSSCFHLYQRQGPFQGVSSLHQVAKVLEFQLQNQSFLWIFRADFPLVLTGLISLQSKGLSRVFQHHSSKASVLRCSAFFMVQFSHPYKTTRKTIALTRWTFVGKVMSLIFNTLPRFVIAFLPRSRCLLISWLQSPLQWFWSPRK